MWRSQKLKRPAGGCCRAREEVTSSQVDDHHLLDTPYNEHDRSVAQAPRSTATRERLAAVSVGRRSQLFTKRCEDSVRLRILHPPGEALDRDGHRTCGGEIAVMHRHIENRVAVEHNRAIIVDDEMIKQLVIEHGQQIESIAQLTLRDCGLITRHTTSVRRRYKGCRQTP